MNALDVVIVPGAWFMAKTLRQCTRTRNNTCNQCMCLDVRISHHYHFKMAWLPKMLSIYWEHLIILFYYWLHAMLFNMFGLLSALTFQQMSLLAVCTEVRVQWFLPIVLRHNSHYCSRQYFIGNLSQRLCFCLHLFSFCFLAFRSLDSMKLSI